VRLTMYFVAMETIISILVALVLMSLVMWIVNTLPLETVPKRIAMAVLGIIALTLLAGRLHWLPLR
jgi:hypothetical protein